MNVGDIWKELLLEFPQDISDKEIVDGLAKGGFNGYGIRKGYRFWDEYVPGRGKWFFTKSD